MRTIRAVVYHAPREIRVEQVAMPQCGADELLVKVPAGVKPEHAALAEPLSCTVNACENCGIRQGDTVVVVGGGPMGILNACAAREFGAGTIIMAEINPARLAQCGPFADLLVNPGTQDLGRIVREQTGGLGADVVIVAAPAGPPQEQALRVVLIP